MTIFAIGDIQGCYEELKCLLDKIKFNPDYDQLWLVGDLVNRGQQSLKVLRFVKGLKKSAVTVLGNHDLTLLAKYVGVRPCKPESSLYHVLKAPDCDELMHWLRHRPLLHYDAHLKFTMVHAGFAPQWSPKQARLLAYEVEQTLRDSDYKKFLANMYSNQPDQWSNDLQGWDRLRFITNCFTRLRYCDPKGRMILEAKGAPGTHSKGVLPWFKVPGRKSTDINIVFGHWSTLGYYRQSGVIALDSGCVWGGRLTAVRLDKNKPDEQSIRCPKAATPG